MRARIADLGRRAAALALLPLSAVPLVLLAPGLVASHTRFDRRFHSPPLAAPTIVLSAAELARYAPGPAYTGAIPVLVYHGINDKNDTYSVSPKQFARQLAMLDRGGYTTISIAQYLRFRAGETAGLPARPLLITFDDGRLDSYRGADRILAAHHMRAVIYVITEPVRKHNPFHLSWEELHRMQRSGRWDIQPHAHDGHRLIVVDGKGRTAPFYANPAFTRSNGLEDFAGYSQRVATDVYALKDDFRAQGLAAQSFAVPFGDHGQRAPARVRRFLDDLLDSQFRVVFVQRPGNDPAYSSVSGPAERLELHTATSVAELHAWLVRHRPQELR